MRSSCPIVLILALITIAAARSSNTRYTSYLKTLKRRLNSDNYEYMLDELISRDIAEDRVVKRQKNEIHLQLKDPSVPGGYGNVSVPWSSGSDTCLKRSSGRGIGTVLITICNPDEEVSGALCYPQCRAGYESIGCCICRQKECPSEFKDDGVATCIKPAPYWRGSGYPWKGSDNLNDKGMFGRCETKHGAANCEKLGLIVYPKCRSEFHAVGCCTCTPDCPDGMNDIGISCGKLNYGRGAGVSRLKCAADKEQDAGLCYTKCPDDWKGVGPICWQSCPRGTPHNCGVMCTVDKSTCEQRTLTIVAAALKVGLKIFVGVSKANAAKMIEAAIKTGIIVADVLSNPYC